MTTEQIDLLLELLTTAVKTPTLVNLSALHDFGIDHDIEKHVTKFLSATTLPFLPIHDVGNSRTFATTYDDARYVHEYRTGSPRYNEGGKSIIVCWLYCNYYTIGDNQIDYTTVCGSFELEMYRENSVDEEVLDSASFTDKIDALTYARMIRMSRAELNEFLEPYIDHLLEIPLYTEVSPTRSALTVFYPSTLHATPVDKDRI